MCRAVDVSLLTTKHDVLNRFKEHFDNLYSWEAEEEDANDQYFLSNNGREAVVKWQLQLGKTGRCGVVD